MRKVRLPITDFNIRVQDEEGTVGTIIDSNDIHNIIVEFDNGGQGLYCLCEGCELAENLYYFE